MSYRFASRAKPIALKHRFIATLIDNLLLINVYLPSCDNTEEYRSSLLDILCAIGEVIDQHQNVKVVIGGDFNFVFCDSKRSYRMLVEFLDEYRLAPMSLPSDSPTAYSYYQETLQHYSLIDHYCVSVDIAAVVSRVSTVDVGNNLSDHLPVEITLHAPDLLTPSVNGSHDVKDDVMYQLRWDKANLHDYDMLTSYYLDAIGLG